MLEIVVGSGRIAKEEAEARDVCLGRVGSRTLLYLLISEFHFFCSLSYLLEIQQQCPRHLFNGTQRHAIWLLLRRFEAKRADSTLAMQIYAAA